MTMKQRFLTDLTSAINSYSEKETRENEGSTQQRDRLAAVARLCCTFFDGDIVEIGCFRGLTTARLAQVARGYHRHVIAIDPWEVGTQNCDGGEFIDFTRNTEKFMDIIEVYRYRSDAPEVKEILKDRKVCMAFVDGLHTYGACRNDIELVSAARLVVVDDITWNLGVRTAFDQSPREHLFYPDNLQNYLREGYLV
jgi:hypothetical protein